MRVLGYGRAFLMALLSVLALLLAATIVYATTGDVGTRNGVPHGSPAVPVAAPTNAAPTNAAPTNPPPTVATSVPPPVATPTGGR